MFDHDITYIFLVLWLGGQAFLVLWDENNYVAGYFGLVKDVRQRKAAQDYEQAFILV